jgi:hypothetical protein
MARNISTRRMKNGEEMIFPLQGTRTVGYSIAVLGHITRVLRTVNDTEVNVAIFFKVT